MNNQKKEEVTSDIRHGDSMDILPRLKRVYDVCIMDPPYSMAHLASSLSRLSYGDCVTNPAQFFWSLLEKLKKILTDNSIIAQFCSWRTLPLLHRAYYDANIQLQSVMVWDKRPHLGPGNYLRPQYELIAFAFLGDAGIPNRCIGDIAAAKNVPTAQRHHPTEKPVELIKYLIQITEATNVVDPFMGSGSVGVACARKGVAYTGIECARKFYDIAEKRINDIKSRG